MLKKRLIGLGLVFAVCLAGQWGLSAHLSEASGPAQTAPPNWLESQAPAQSQNLDNLHQNLVRQLLVMTFIVALFGGALWWFVRKYSKGLLVGKGRFITILETIPLGPRKTVHLLEVGHKKLLIGSTPDSIRLLADLTEPDQPSSSQKDASQ
ncbi:MAG: flagellar biosynthetic protein FliO [Anaerohalosphaeraceae bacterium]